jgi:hypothetical protein
MPATGAFTGKLKTSQSAGMYFEEAMRTTMEDADASEISRAHEVDTQRILTEEQVDPLKACRASCALGAAKA